MSNASLFTSSSALENSARGRITVMLQQSLSNGLDLASQIKVAHWNLRGPFFLQLHAHFDALYDLVSEQNDTVAERLVTLGGRAQGSVRVSARDSKVSELPELTRDRDFLRAITERLDTHLQGLRGAREVAEGEHDGDTVDVLTGIVIELEKQGWFLRASLDG